MTAFSKQTRIILHIAMIVLGTAIVALATLLMDIRALPALAVALGALLLSVGLMGIIRFLPKADRRANRVLRAEIDHLISLTRDLYRYRTLGDAAMIHETKAQLRENLDRIIKAASLYQEEPEQDREEPEKAGSPTPEE